MKSNYILQALTDRGGVENASLKAKDTKKKRGQRQPYREQTLSRPRTQCGSDFQKKKVFSPDLGNFPENSGVP